MALYYWVGGTNTWTSAVQTGRWSNASGVTPATYTTNPGVGDEVFFDGASGAVTVTLATGQTVGKINFTGFTGTFIFAAGLSSGDTTLGASTTYTASGGNPTTYSFTPRNVSSTFTANGKILPTNLTLTGLNLVTITFAGDADFGGNMTTSTIQHTIKAAALTTVNLRIGGNISINAMVTNAAEYVTIKGYGINKTFFSGGGVNSNMRVSFVSGSSYTPTASSSAGAGQNFLTVETGGKFTSPNITHGFSSPGTVTLSGFNSSNNDSYFFGLGGQGTYNLSNDTVIKSFINITSLNMTVQSTGGERLLLEGNFTSVGTGTVSIKNLEFSGSSASNVTATMGSGANLTVQSLTINKSTGGSVNFNSNGVFTLFIPSGTTYSWTHTAGVVTQGNNCTIKIWGSALNSQFNYSAPSPNVFTFGDLEFFTNGIINLSTPINATKISIIPSGTTISITSPTTSGFTTEKLVVANTTSLVKSVTLKSGVTYNITANLSMQNFGGSIINLGASLASPSPKALFNLATTATQDVISVNPNNIDSSGNNGVGSPIYQTIFSQNGVITPTTFNWSNGSQPPPVAAKITVGYTFVN